MTTASYTHFRGTLETYFDRTAAKAWEQLTSDAPVSGIRATVRAGRTAMRDTLLSWLPADMTGRSLLDAGCGTGALAVEAARRGAAVTAIDLSPTLIALAQERAPQRFERGRVEFRVGDMFDAGLGSFDHVVAMDSLIHYATADVVPVIASLAARCGASLLFTFAPRTALLAVMHAAGRLFPRGHRAPAIEPVGERDLRRRLGADPGLANFGAGRTHRIACGFYTSQAQEIVRR